MTPETVLYMVAYARDPDVEGPYGGPVEAGWVTELDSLEAIESIFACHEALQGWRLANGRHLQAKAATAAIWQGLTKVGLAVEAARKLGLARKHLLPTVQDGVASLLLESLDVLDKSFHPPVRWHMSDKKRFTSYIKPWLGLPPAFSQWVNEPDRFGVPSIHRLAEEVLSGCANPSPRLARSLDAAATKMLNVVKTTPDTERFTIMHGLLARITLLLSCPSDADPPVANIRRIVIAMNYLALGGLASRNEPFSLSRAQKQTLPYLWPKESLKFLSSNFNEVLSVMRGLRNLLHVDREDAHIRGTNLAPDGSIGFMASAESVIRLNAGYPPYASSQPPDWRVYPLPTSLASPRSSDPLPLEETWRDILGHDSSIASKLLPCERDALCIIPSLRAAVVSATLAARQTAPSTTSSRRLRV